MRSAKTADARPARRASAAALVAQRLRPSASRAAGAAARRCRAAGSRPAADVAAHARSRAAATSSSGGRGQRAAAARAGRGSGERAQLLGPAERRRPAQPAEPVGRVGDHRAAGRASAEHARRELERDRVGSARAGSRPRRRPTKTGSDRDDRERQVGRAAHGQAAGRKPTKSASQQHRPRRPRSRRAAATNAAARGRRRRRARAPAGPASSSARSARTAAEQPAERGEDRQRPADAPAGVAADGEQVVRHAVEQAHGVVVAEARARTRAGRRAVGYALRDSRSPGRPYEREQESSANEIVRRARRRTHGARSALAARHGRPRAS